MNDSGKRKLIDLLLRRWNADVVCLFETKMSGLRQDDIMQVGGSRWSECVELEAQGNSGGIVVYWGKRRWSCMDKYVGHHSITTFLQEENSGFQCTFTGVYAPCDRKVRRVGCNLWFDLTTLGNWRGLQCCQI